MKNLGPLQEKYELAKFQNWMAEQNYSYISSLIDSYLTEAPVASATASPQAQQAAPAPAQPAQPVTQPAPAPAPAQQAAPAPAAAPAQPAQPASQPAPAPAQQAAPAQQTPQTPQQAVQQISKQELPSVVDKLIQQIAKTDPNSLAQLKQAVDSNDVNAVNAIIKSYSAKNPVKETTVEEIIVNECVQYFYKIGDIGSIKKLEEFINSGGDTSIIIEHVNEVYSPNVLLEFYQEFYLNEAPAPAAAPAAPAGAPAAGGRNPGLISRGFNYLKGLFKGASSKISDWIGTYGPWSLLGAIAGAGLTGASGATVGAAVLPLIKAALSRYSGGGSTSTSSISGSAEPGASPRPPSPRRKRDGGGGGGRGGGIPAGGFHQHIYNTAAGRDATVAGGNTGQRRQATSKKPSAAQRQALLRLQNLKKMNTAARTKYTNPKYGTGVRGWGAEKAALEKSLRKAGLITENFNLQFDSVYNDIIANFNKNE